MLSAFRIVGEVGAVRGAHAPPTHPGQGSMSMASGRTLGVTDAVYQHLTNHRNQEVHVDDIADAVNYDRVQVMSSVSYIKTQLGATIESPRRGWYVFRGSPSNGKAPVPLKAKAEVVALLDDGRVLLTIEGTLYIAHELVIDDVK